jgi:ATP-dependent RNA helicase DDX42
MNKWFKLPKKTAPLPAAAASAFGAAPAPVSSEPAAAAAAAASGASAATGFDGSASAAAATASAAATTTAATANGDADEDDEDDPLEAFMAGIDGQVASQRHAVSARSADQQALLDATKPALLSEEARDGEGQGAAAGGATAGGGGGGAGAGTASDWRQGDGDDEEDDSDDGGGRAAAARRDGGGEVEELPPADHEALRAAGEYEHFERCFFTEEVLLEPRGGEEGAEGGAAGAAAAGGSGEVTADRMRRDLSITVTPQQPSASTTSSSVTSSSAPPLLPRPIRSFAELRLPASLAAELVARGLRAPTPIQAQALPLALGGRDLIGIARTGSGKTYAFAWPLLVHVCAQRRVQGHPRGEGPIALVLAPTRELAHQIFGEVRRFGRPMGARVAAVYGGTGKWEQVQALRAGAEVVVATPGRLIDLVRRRATNLRRVTFLVLDEADRMFEMGFEAQLRSLAGQVRGPERRTASSP